MISGNAGANLETVSTIYSNISSTTSTGPSTQTSRSVCCFVIQDTVTENWWPVTTTTQLVNLTSITTLITPYPNRTVTNIVTNIYPTNASFPVGQNPIADYYNAAPQPQEVSIPLNGTAVVTAGVTM